MLGPRSSAGKSPRPNIRIDSRSTHQSANLAYPYGCAQPTRFTVRSMSQPTPPFAAWQPTQTANRAADVGNAWQSTKMQTAMATQFLRDESDYLGGEPLDVGHSISPTDYEIFVSCAPALAMEQQFDHVRPDYIAVHDIGAAVSKKLLAGLAAASGSSIKQLHIRRQGYGNTLATLEFVELPTPDGASLRMYTTETQSDPASRYALARTLLARSRLGVLIVGDLPPEALATALTPLRDEISRGAWPNRDLLILPLMPASALASQVAQLSAGSDLKVRTTPQVTKPADAWTFIQGTWNRLCEQMVAAPPAPAPARAPASTNGGELRLGGWQATEVMNRQEPKPIPGGEAPAPLQMARFEPSVPPNAFSNSAPPPAPRLEQAASSIPSLVPISHVDASTAGVLKSGASPIASPVSSPPLPPLLERYVRQVSALKGVVSCCVFDLLSGAPLAHAGTKPSPAELASQGQSLVAALVTSGRSLGLGQTVAEASITLDGCHLVLKPLPLHPHLMLHTVLDKVESNLTLARLQIQRLDVVFDAPAV